MIARRTWSRLDRATPDDLPQSAGAWLEGRIAAHGLPVGSIVTTKYSDAYMTRERFIRLRDTTYFKSDPVHWAIAAHELGHAQIRHDLPGLGTAELVTARLISLLIPMGVGLSFGYVLYDLTAAREIAFGCFVAALALSSLRLVEEAAASLLAMRELRGTELAPRKLRAARLSLLAAFGTYLAGFLAYALLLAQWSLIDRLVVVPAAPSTLTTVGTVVAAIASVIVVLGALGRIAFTGPRWLGRTLFSRPPALAFTLFIAMILSSLATTIVVVLVWDQALGATFRACMVLAMAACAAWIQAAVTLPGGVPATLFTWFLRTLEGPGVDETTDFVRARARGRDAIAAGNRRMDEVPNTLELDLPVFALWRLCAVPLVIVFWLA